MTRLLKIEAPGAIIKYFGRECKSRTSGENSSPVLVIQVITGNQAWRHREHVYYDDYMHMVSNRIPLRPGAIHLT